MRVASQEKNWYSKPGPTIKKNYFMAGVRLHKFLNVWKLATPTIVQSSIVLRNNH